MAHTPMPGFEPDKLKDFFDNNELFGLLNLFSGGAMENFSIAMMGVGPYITASIIFQLLVMIVPSLEALSKEGEYGRKKINQYTRYATLPLAFIQSYAMTSILRNQGIVSYDQSFNLITMLIALSTGSMLLMWIGELISENGIGNGISLIISLGILEGIPVKLMQVLSQNIDSTKIIGIVIFIAIAILITGLVVWANYGERQIPITYARRVRGTRSYGGVDTHLPLRVTMAGVIPIIFALSMMVFPGIIAKFFAHARSEQLSNIANWVESIFQNNIIYGILYFILVLLFTFFYTSVIFQPKQVAENLQKRGGFIPGLRPGTETAKYISDILYKITFIGSIFLAFIAVLPFIVQAITNVQSLVLGGTGILIVVSVILETIRQVKAQLVMRRYEQY